MKNIIHTIIIVLALVCFGFTNASSQEINFKAMKCSAGTAAKNLTDVYAWGPWLSSKTEIIIDLSKGYIKVDGAEYEIIERPKNWIIKKDFKYVSFGCSTPNFDKANIKLYQYDRGEFRIYVNEEKSAMRYVVQYLDK